MRSHCPANSLTLGNLLLLPAGIAFQPGAPQLTLLCQDIVAPLPRCHFHACKGGHSTECVLQVVLHNKCKVLTKVAPGQPAPISHCDSILPTPKLFVGIAFISALHVHIFLAAFSGCLHRHLSHLCKMYCDEGMGCLGHDLVSCDTRNAHGQLVGRQVLRTEIQCIVVSPEQRSRC